MTLKVGDRVVSRYTTVWYHEGDVGTIMHIYHNSYDVNWDVARCPGSSATHWVINFEDAIPYVPAEYPTLIGETDPNGKSANEPGSKLDAGKVRVGLVLDGFARALWEVSRVGTFGAIKYTDNGWMEVPNGIARYHDAAGRHDLKIAMGEEYDADSGVLHLAHSCWNKLAELDLLLRSKENK